MERVEWLKQMRNKAEKLYDHYSLMVKCGRSMDETHGEYLRKFLKRVPPRSKVLSAACGAGRYDGMLLEAGHSVVGIDQSAGMLARAREHFPEARYEKIGLQEMDFREEFNGVTCIDAMEHICPEDWPGILQGFREALKPDGVLYFTFWPRELAGIGKVEEAYKRAKRQGLPVVFGEVADQVEEAYKRMIESEKATDESVYHYCPSLEQVREWIRQTELVIEEEGTGDDYEHFVVRKR